MQAFPIMLSRHGKQSETPALFLLQLDRCRTFLVLRDESPLR